MMKSTEDLRKRLPDIPKERIQEDKPAAIVNGAHKKVTFYTKENCFVTIFKKLTCQTQQLPDDESEKLVIHTPGK